MDTELKEYLDKNMATKTDLQELRNDIKNLDEKIDAVNKDLTGYLKHIDSELQEHRHDSEVHKKVAF